MLGPDEWKQLVQSMSSNSELAKIEDFAWSGKVLEKGVTVVDLGRKHLDKCRHGRDRLDDVSALVVLVALLQRPNAASITRLDLRFNTFPNMGIFKIIVCPHDC